MPSNCKANLLLFLALPAIVAAFNLTDFSYFKDTPFGPCDPSKYPMNNASLLYSDFPAAHFAFTTRSLTQAEFCSSFWNHTVISTLPNSAAFGFTWLSCLTNCISFLISLALLYYTAMRHPKPESEYYPLRSLDDDASSIQPAPKPTDPPFGKIFWTTFTCDCIKTVLWWTSFIQLVRSSTTASPISLIQWITPYGYRVALAESRTKWRRWLRWPALVLTIIEFGCSLYAALLIAKTPLLPIDADATLTTVTYQLTQDPFMAPNGISPSPCSRTDAAKAVLLSDPAAPVRQLIYFIGALIAVLFFIPSVVLELRGKITRRSMLVFQIYAIGAVQGTMALVMKLVLWRSTPLSWDNDCAVVHIMMSPDAGYWDVRFAQFWRILKAWFNV